MRCLCLVACLVLAGCARHHWAPGPNAQIVDFEQQRAQCSLMARHGGTGFVAAGNPNYVAGAVVGHAIGDAVRTQTDFNDCMAATGWKAVD